MTGRGVIGRGLQGLDLALQWIAMALMAVVVFSVTWQVLARYVVSTSSAWTSELASLAFVWLAMLAIPIGIRRGRHMVLDIWEYFPYRKWLERSVTTVSAIIVVATFLLLVWFGFEAARPAFNRTMAGLPISFGWIALSVPVGAIFSAVFAIEAWWRLIHAEKDVDPLDDPVLYQPDDVVVIKGEV
ncbi:TRAP transporter small permease [Microbacterium sp.]|uniref:TRAP transporter small permease n=1 Tax=Microbacterium sp. TaxID=51671 RepID=UPI0032214BBA